MMKKKIFIFTFILALCIKPLSAYAKDWLNCNNIQNKQSYQGRESLEFLVAGVQDWLFISKKDFMEEFALTEKTLQSFEKFQAELKSKGTDLVLVVVPQRGLVHIDKIDFTNPFTQSYRPEKARQNFIDMIKQLETAKINIAPAPDFSKISEYGYARDHHWNSKGAELIANLTAQKIKTLSSYNTIKKQEFKIAEGKEISFKGSFYNPIKDICNKQLPIEKIKEQISVTINDDLFSETKKEIVLVGTSFSEEGKSFANFSGHLRIALSADIDNRSIGGGGVSTSLLKYLESKDFKTNPAKILIWEVPGFYNLNRQTLLEQAMKEIKANDSK